MITLLHPAERLLRRLVDEPLLVPDRTKAHVQRCPRCSARLATFRSEVQEMRRLLAPESGPDPDVRKALAAVQRRLQASARVSRTEPRARLPRPLGRIGRPAQVALAAVLLAAATGTATALAGVHWTEIFAPTQVEQLPVTRSELLALPHLSEFGELSQAERLKLTAEPSLAAAEAAAGVTLNLPGELPPGLHGSPDYFLVPRWTSTFTFSSARAQAAALAAGVALPPLPAGFNGTKLRESAGPGVLAVYGLGSDTGGLGLADLLGARKQEASCAKSAAKACPGQAASSSSAVPQLVLAAVRPPVLDSTGVTVIQLENYLLKVPFLPPSLAAAIRNLGNPLTSLPIPILAGVGRSSTTTVNGAKAVLFAAASPLLSAVVWEQRGLVRADGGLLDSASVLKLARG
ncbi:MAG: anti-sigma factor family protein [Candidatus Dormibacteria bacterium]